MPIPVLVELHLDAANIAQRRFPTLRTPGWRSARRLSPVCVNFGPPALLSDAANPGLAVGSSVVVVRSSEPVSDGSHGGDPRGPFFTELGPQPSDMNVHGSGTAVVVITPDLGQELFA